MYAAGESLLYFRHKSVSAADLSGCGVSAAAPGQRNSSDVRSELDMRFTLNFTNDSQGRRILNVTSISSWRTDLAFACCGICPTGSASQLEEVDLSYNRMSGPPPVSFSELKVTLRNLNLEGNTFQGDYTRLTEIEYSYLRADGGSLLGWLTLPMPVLLPQVCPHCHAAARPGRARSEAAHRAGARVRRVQRSAGARTVGAQDV